MGQANTSTRTDTVHTADLKKKFLDAYTTSFGIVTVSCKLTGISRAGFYKWMKDDPEFKAEIDAIEPGELKRDFVEAKLLEKARNNDTAVLIFMAKTLCKDRGYVERTETVLKTDQPVTVTMNIKD